MTPHERVARGAAFMDANYPGWVDKIDLNTLDIHSACDCVLGQAGLSYTNTWIEHFSAKAGEMKSRGFATTKAENESVNAAWRDLIMARRGAELLKQLEVPCEVTG